MKSRNRKKVRKKSTVEELAISADVFHLLASITSYKLEIREHVSTNIFSRLFQRLRMLSPAFDNRQQRAVQVWVDILKRISRSYFNDRSEELLILRDIDTYIARYGTVNIRSFLVNGVLGRNSHAPVSINNISPIFISVLKGHTRLTKRFLSLGVKPGLSASSDNPAFANISPLMLACECDDPGLVKLLLRHHPKVLQQDGIGKNALMKAKSKEVCRALIEYAYSHHELITLLKQKDQAGKDVFGYFSENKDIQDYIARLCKHILRKYYWETKDANLQTSIEETIKYLRTLSPDFRQAKDFSWELRLKMTLDRSSDALFGEKYGSHRVYNKVYNKNIAIKLAISTIHHLLANPGRTLKYLKQLNDGFVAYCNENGFKLISPDKNSYSFEKIDGLNYPIPLDSYATEKKYSALQTYLISLLKKHGLANHTYKWIGFIPQKDANEMVVAGDFAVESRLGVGLFHNKLAHMFHFAIVLLAMESGEIPVKYLTDTKEEKTLSFSEIFRVIVDRKVASSSSRLWQNIFDSRYFPVHKFNDPYCLSSIIMSEGEKMGFKPLADFMIDSFCKGMIKLLSTVNQAKSPLKISMSDLVAMVDDHQLEDFSSLMSFLQTDINREKHRGGHFVSFSNEHAVVEKDYEAASARRPRM